MPTRGGGARARRTWGAVHRLVASGAGEQEGCGGTSAKSRVTAPPWGEEPNRLFCCSSTEASRTCPGAKSVPSVLPTIAGLRTSNKQTEAEAGGRGRLLHRVPGAPRATWRICSFRWRRAHADGYLGLSLPAEVWIRYRCGGPTVKSRGVREEFQGGSHGGKPTRAARLAGGQRRRRRELRRRRPDAGGISEDGRQSESDAGSAESTVEFVGCKRSSRV